MEIVHRLELYLCDATGATRSTVEIGLSALGVKLVAGGGPGPAEAVDGSGVVSCSA